MSIDRKGEAIVVLGVYSTGKLGLGASTPRILRPSELLCIWLDTLLTSEPEVIIFVGTESPGSSTQSPCCVLTAITRQFATGNVCVASSSTYRSKAAPPRAMIRLCRFYEADYCAL